MADEMPTETQVEIEAGPTLLIIWFSRTGGSQAMALAAAEAARRCDEANIALQRAEATSAADMLNAQGYIFVFPENLAAIAGGMKEFFDSVYYDLLGQIEGRPYAAMICAGSDGENARRQVERIATGWRLRKMADSLIICTNAQSDAEITAPKTLSPADIAKCEELGGAFAMGLAMGVF